MLIGYARVSTTDQTLDLQKDALEKIGCSKIFTDTASGAKAERKGLEEALDYVREGDTLVVWRLDRLGRSLKHLIETISILDNRQIGAGRNNNEDTWRIRRGCLKFFADDGKVYSRFRLDKASGRSACTNDPDLRSLFGQYLSPQY